MSENQIPYNPVGKDNPTAKEYFRAMKKRKLFEECKKYLVLEPMSPGEYRKRILKIADGLGVDLKKENAAKQYLTLGE